MLLTAGATWSDMRIWLTNLPSLLHEAAARLLPFRRYTCRRVTMVRCLGHSRGAVSPRGDGPSRRSLDLVPVPRLLYSELSLSTRLGYGIRAR